MWKNKKGIECDDRMKSEDLIYLDTEFISSKYEELTNESATTLITKEQGIAAGVGLSFLKSDLHSKELKQYKISTYRMWLKISDEIKKYPSFKPGDYSTGQRSTTAWVKGTFSMGEWSKEENEKDQINRFFEIEDESAKYALLVCNEYFFQTSLLYKCSHLFYKDIYKFRQWH
jgi:hypothetical protein